ncbi:MAG: hypothetical protein ACI9WU_004931 [Myxococcota bacterium]|jgi:hypothetical protein
MTPYFELWMVAFAWTLALEAPVYTLLLHRRLGVGRALASGLLASCITHPLLWFVVPQFAPYNLFLVVAESGVVVFETLIVAASLRHFTGDPRWRLSFVASLVANVSSAVIGSLWL